MSRERTKYDPWFDCREALYTIGHIAEHDRVQAWARTKPSPAYVLPPFQREYVWSPKQQERLIQSIWGGVPIGFYVLNYSPTFGPTHAWLVDGQQRWGAILAYTRGDLEVLGERFTDLEEGMQRRFMTKVFPCLLMSSDDPAELERIYDLLAYGGTPHEPKAASPDRVKEGGEGR